MKTKVLPALVVVAILLAAVLAPAMGLSLLNDSNSSFPVPVTPTPSPPDEESDNNTTDTDTEANETEIIDDEIPLPPLSENLRIIGKDSFSVNETPEFVIEIEQAFIDAIADVSDGEAKHFDQTFLKFVVEVQFHVEGCEGNKNRLDLFVEEEETSPSSNITIYRVTIPNNKTGTEELTPGIYTLVVVVGEQSVEHAFEWGLGTEPETEPGDEIKEPLNLSENLEIIGKDSFGANETPEFFIQIQQAFIDAVSDANSGKPVQVQIYVEGCNGSRIELFVEEEETSPSSNISIYRVTISNNKTGLETEELTPEIYTLVVEVGEQSVEHSFKWGVEPEPTYVEPQPQNLTVNVTTKPVLTAKKKHFVLNENPTFKFKFNYKTKAEAETNATSLKPLAISEPRKALKAWVTSEETIKTSVYYKDELLDIKPEIEKLGEGDFSIKIPTQRAFRAGLYKLKVELVTDGKTYVEEQDFTWGVLAINTHKSIYLPDETAFIGMAVLDDEGHMVCDADVTLTITDYSNKETVLSTGNGLIKVSPECSVYGVTNLPDYYTNYKVGGVGTYVMTLTAVTPDGTGTKSITDEFTVQNSVDFDVARSGPTRIYPPVPYVMKFTIKANKNYNGLIKEYVPASFEITAQEGLTITTVGDAKILSWNRNLVRGEDYNIYYEFDAPDISPYLFVLGRLQIGGFEEKRDWMIASDSPDTYYFNAYDDVSGEEWATNPGNMVDSATGTYASTETKNQVQLLNANTCPGTDLGTISKVELRAYGYAGTNDKIYIRPVFTGGDGANYEWSPGTTAAWSPYSDITSDTNAPSPWTWTDVQNLDVDIQKLTVQSADIVYIAKVEIQVTYTASDTTPPSITNENLNITELKTGETVRLNATISDPESDVTEVKFKIKYPDETSANFSATEITPDYWEYNFSDTSQMGEYNWTDTYATSGGGTNHTTPAKTFNASDGTKPVPSNIGANETAAGVPCLFHAYWTDNVGLANYTFAWNDTETGEWVNDSVVSFSGTGNWSNVTKTLSSTPKTIGWRIYANDTAGNLNDTGIQILTIETTLTLRPNAMGTYQNWITFGAGSAHWDRTADESDATGVEITGDTSSKETENLDDPTFHNSSTINSVTVYARCMTDGTGQGEKGVIITRTGGSDYESSPAFDLSRTKWIDHSVEYIENPGGGGAWTKAQITDLEVGTRAVQIGGTETMNCSEYWVVVDYTPDTTPPASITNLTNVTGQTWINWTWDNPQDADFNYTMVYLDGVWETNTFAPFYNATGFEPDTPYEIATHTVDEVGNINETWVNQTTKTEPDIQAPQWSDPQTNKTTIYQNDYVKFTANWTDDVDLAGYKFSINQTGTWINSSFTPFSGTFNISENVTQITAPAGTTVQWRFYANDTSNNLNVTDIQSFIVAALPSTPFMIYGRVFYEDGSECLDPTVRINNTNTSITWQADTNASYNYYRLILDTTNISAGNVLEFNTSDGIRYNTTTHVVTEDEINDGGLFNFNFTLPTPPSPSTSYMIYGWVFYKNGTACDNPTVNITNMNNSKQWQAETNASYNFYQITLAGGSDLNASEVLQFNVKAPDASQLNTTNHTVTQTEIDSGGLFSYNITLEAPETPFMIYGWVNYSNGTACNGSTVNVTNTNTSITWQAETNASYNFYQLVLDTTNISAGNVLSFNATDGSQYNLTNHTVTQSDINNGGLFNFNLTLPSAADTTPPEWRSQGQNVSQIPVGGSILLYAQGKDETALDFAILETNETGGWANITDGSYGSPMDMADATDWTWSNFTWQNSSISAGTTIGWRIWYNDTANNWNKTDIMCFGVITGAPPTVDSITITPDGELSKEGVQINPTPGSNKTVNISAVVSDLNGWDDIVNVTANITGPGTVTDSPVSLNLVSHDTTTATYNGTFNMSFYYLNGTYTVDVTATDNGSLTGSNSTTFNYTTAIGLELDSTLINFSSSGPIDPGGTSEVLGDENMETLNNATVRNIGNVVIDVEVNGTDMTSAGNIITKDNIEARINETSYQDMSVARCFDVNMTVNASSLENADFKLFVPYGTPRGNYSGTITLTAKTC